MKKIIKQSKISLIIGSALVGFSGISFAQTASCKDSFAPQFVCERWQDLTSNFSIGNILNIIYTVGIAALVVFILFQIVRAIFKWVSKAGDEKERTAAIKSISSAIIAGLVLVVLLFAVPFVADLLNIGGKPNPLYACYNAIDFQNAATNMGGYQAIVDPYAVTIRNNVSLFEPSGILTYEGKPENGSTPQNNDTKKYLTLVASTTNKVTGQPDPLVFDQSFITFMQESLYCRDKNTGKEYAQKYVIVKRVGVSS